MDFGKEELTRLICKTFFSPKIVNAHGVCDQIKEDLIQSVCKRSNMPFSSFKYKSMYSAGLLSELRRSLWPVVSGQ